MMMTLTTSLLKKRHAHIAIVATCAVVGITLAAAATLQYFPFNVANENAPLPSTGPGTNQWEPTAHTTSTAAEATWRTAQTTSTAVPQTSLLFKSVASFNFGRYLPVSSVDGNDNGTIAWTPYRLAPWSSTVGPDAGPRNGTHILTFGDSVDRLVVIDSCVSWNGTLRYHWGAPHIQYSGIATSMCSLPWGSLSHVHHFGASPEGPYANLGPNHKANQYDLTVNRIPKALEIYKQIMGHDPHVVVYQSNVWDCAYHGETTKPFNRSDSAAIEERVRRFMGYISDNYDQIVSLVSPSTIVLMRTTPNMNPSHRGYPYQGGFNAAIRYLGVQREVGVIDWDLMASDVRRFGDDFLRDSVHPVPAHTAAYGSALVQFSIGLVHGKYLDD